MSGSDLVRVKYKVLNEFRHSRNGGNKGGPMGLGTDYSSKYSAARNLNLYIYDGTLNSLITFKGFLETFSINFDIQYKEEDTVEGSAPTNPTNFTCNYEIKMQVPAPSINDAKVNDARFAELSRMIVGAVYVDGDTRRYVDQPKRVLLGNLIHNGRFPENAGVEKLYQIKKFGLLSRINNVSWDPDIEAGFFENSYRLWPKAYSFSLNLNVAFNLDAKLGPGKRSFCGFRSGGSYDSTDYKKWPFGVV